MLAPKLTCTRCGLPLDSVRTEFEVIGNEIQFENEWIPRIAGEVISCAAGHRFEAIYEQREPWLKVLVGFGEELEAGSSRPGEWD